MKPRFRFAPPRRDSDAFLPAILALVLGGLCVAQVLLTDEVELPPVGAVAPRAARPLRIADGDAIVAPVILQRAIFAPRGGGPAAAPVDPLGGMVVAGAVRLGARAYAIVQLPGGKAVRLRVGGTVNGWRLVGLGDDGARFARGSEHRTAPFGARPAAPPPAEGEGL